MSNDNRKNTITGVFIDPENGIAEKHTIEKSLVSYYKLLDCDCIDIQTRYIDNRAYDIICDDEALLHGNPIVSAVNSKGMNMFYGKLFIVKYDGDGDVVSLSDNDIQHVLHNLIVDEYIAPNNSTVALVCEYRHTTPFTLDGFPGVIITLP